MKSIIVSGNIVQIQSKYSIPVDRLSVAIEPVQSGSGNPSPDNVRPISGGDGVRVTRCGKNLIGIPGAIDTAGNINDNAYTMAHGIRSDIMPTVPGARYTGTKKDSFSETWANVLVMFYDGNKVFLESRTIIAYNAQSGTVTVPSGAGYVSFSVTQGGTSFDGYDVQIEFGSVATEYEPYLGETYSIAFPAEAGTVYGGTLDVTTGLLTVDRGMVDLGTLEWKVEAAGGAHPNWSIFYAAVPNAKGYFAAYGTTQICSHYANQTEPTWNDKSCRFGFSSANINISDSALSGYTAAQFKAAMSGVQLAYELATPVTYQLDPVAVDLLSGANTLWADAGAIEVEYRPYARAVFDGISTIDYDVYVYPTDTMYQAPAHQYTMLTVPGRSGSLLIDEKRFDNIDREYGVVIAESGKVNIDLLRNALASRGGYFRLEDTFDTTHFFMATYNKIFTPAIDWRGNSAKITLSFNCKPQRYLKSGETVIDMSSSGNITNPTRFSAKPLLRVYGNGVLGVGSTNITITGNTYSYVDIDCDMGRAYYGATPLDSKITLNTIDYPELTPGNNGIVLGTGITRVIITPRWWEL